MKNSDMPAMPLPLGSETVVGQEGLTKREMLAMSAMQGILSNSNDRYTYEQLAGHAVSQADALLSELEKQK